MKYAYLRVSHPDQNLDRQITWAKSQGCTHIIQEKHSAYNGDLVKLNKLIKKLQPGDELYLDGIDRLSRKGLEDGLAKVKLINSKDVKIITATGIVFTKENAFTELIAAVLSWVANYEYEERRRRQQAGIERAKVAGRYKGRPANPMYHTLYRQANALVESGNYSVAHACRQVGISRAYYYRLKDNDTNQTCT